MEALNQLDGSQKESTRCHDAKAQQSKTGSRLVKSKDGTAIGHWSREDGVASSSDVSGMETQVLSSIVGLVAEIEVIQLSQEQRSP